MAYLLGEEKGRVERREKERGGDWKNSDEKCESLHDVAVEGEEAEERGKDKTALHQGSR